MLGRFFRVVILVLFACGVSATSSGIQPALTITEILRNGASVSDVADVILRDLRGTVVQRGVHIGNILPDNVRVEVPTTDVVTITASNGKSIATLSGGCSAFFHFTGKFESVTVTGGKATFDDPVDFFRVNGPGGVDTSGA